MAVGIQINLNEKLFLRDPHQSDLGRNILQHSILLIDELGFEEFTFKKLAQRINSTEASVYRYFENKHLLLIYLVSWYWERLSYLILFHTHNLKNVDEKLEQMISCIVSAAEDDPKTAYIEESVLHRIVIAEGTKAYHTKKVDEENSLGFFMHYKNLIHRMADIITEKNSEFVYPNSLATAILQLANDHLYYANHLPKLTDFKDKRNKQQELQTMLMLFISKMLG